jgi:hypothetical protein
VFVVLVGIGAYIGIQRFGTTIRQRPRLRRLPRRRPQIHATFEYRYRNLNGTAKFFRLQVVGRQTDPVLCNQELSGVYRAALDACDTCYHAKKGYHQEGDDMGLQ